MTFYNIPTGHVHVLLKRLMLLYVIQNFFPNKPNLTIACSMLYGTLKVAIYVVCISYV